MSEAMTSAILHVHCLNQDHFSNKFPVTDDEQYSGSEKDNHLEESFESQGDNERLCVQDIINYFESKAEVSTSTTKDLESNIHLSSTIASPERVASRRWNGASNELSQVSIDDRTSVSEERCLSTYECSHDYDSESILHARLIDVSSESIKSNRRFDDHDATLSSHGSWSELQSKRITSSSHRNFDKVDVLNDSLGRKGTHANDFTPAYEPNLKKEQYLLAYDSKLRLRSETMRLPSSNVRNNGDGFPNFTTYETEILDDMNRIVYPKKVASNGSLFSPERRGVCDPVLQSHIYLTKDLAKFTSRWKDLREVDQSASSDSFFVPGRSMSNEQADNSWKRNLNFEEESIICQGDDAYYVNKKRSDEERPPYYNDLLVIAERSAGECTSDRSSMFPLDCDVKLMNDRSYDYQQNSKRREKDSVQNTSARTKTEPPGFKTNVKTLDLRGRRSDVIKTESQRPVRSVKSLNNDAEVKFRAEIPVSKNGNPAKAKKVETVKRVEDTRSQIKDRMTAQRNTSGPSKSVDSLPRASSFQLTSAKPQNISKSSPSSSNAGKVMLCHMDLSSDSTRSSATDSHLARRTNIQKNLPTVGNRTVSDNEKSRSRSVPFSIELRKDNNKTLHVRTKGAIVRQPNVPPQLRKVEKKL